MQIDSGEIASGINNAAPSQEAAPQLEDVPTEGGEQPAAAEPEQQQPTPPEQDPDFVRRFNALARKERELLQRESEMKERLGEFENYQKERAKLKESPIEFLESNGWKFQDLADYVLNNNKPTAETQVSRLQKRLDEMEAERKAEIENRERQAKEEENKKTITAFKNSIKELVSSNNEQYELINHFNAIDTVYDVIQNYYNQNGEVLDTAKAAAEVEKYLEQQFEQAASTSKFKKRYSPIEQALAEASEEKKVSQAPDTRTLTNEAVASTPSPSQAESTYLPEEESKRKSAEILKEWMLKRQGYTKS